MIKPKMDLAKALGMMGFGSARIEDQSGKRNALDELNNALSRQMENMEERKKKIEKTEKIEARKEAQHDKLRDDIRTMHEAYQFLAAKYRNDAYSTKHGIFPISTEQHFLEPLFDFGSGHIYSKAMQKCLTYCHQGI